MTQPTRRSKSKEYWIFKLLPPSPGEPLTEKTTTLAWLIRLRWTAILIAALGGIAAFKFVFLQPSLAYPYFGVVAFLVFFNLYATLELKEDKPLANLSVFFPLAVDTLSLTLLLAISGGIRNPFISLFFVQTAMGALLLERNDRIRFATLVLMCLIAVFLTRDWQVLSADIYVQDFAPLVAMMLSLCVSWVLVASLTDTLTTARQKLDEAKSRDARIYHLLALGALSSEFAHQFATPLNTLRLRIDRLRKLSHPQPTESEIAAAADALTQAEEILRESASTPLDSSMLTRRQLPMTGYLEQAIADWEVKNPATKVRSQVSLSPHLRYALPTALFSKSLFNLLDNALWAQGPSMDIEVVARETDEQIIIEVLDRGPGWPEELRTQGIRPFGTLRAGGTGLGLFNCQSLCEIMSGSLELVDRKGGGAIAQIRLPKTSATAHLRG